MAKIKYYELSPAERRTILNDFCEMVVSLKGKQDVEKFFKDLLTPSEAVIISRRIKIAKLLMTGSTYEDIKEQLGVGNTTIVQVERWLNEGFGGYRKALKKLDKKGEKIRIMEEALPFSLNHLRRNYPAHYLLLNLLRGDF
jgi:TrpR-related protein YerC/YecD